MKEEKRVLFTYHPSNIYCNGKGGVFQFGSGYLPIDTDFLFWNDTLWCLFDAKNKNESDLGKFPYELCTFVISTSAQQLIVNDFKKSPPPQEFFMPIWTEVELDAIAPSYPSANEWRNSLEHLDGIPRQVLEDTRKSAVLLLEAACRSCELNDCIKIIGMDSTITDKSKAVHSLVHITSDSPYTDLSVCYTSPKALDIFVQQKGVKAKRKMRGLLDS